MNVTKKEVKTSHMKSGKPQMEVGSGEYCAVKSPFTFGSFDLGDTYVREIEKVAIKVWSEKEGEIK